MIHTPEFWSALGLAFILYWVVPPRFRMASLALCSFGYLATIDWFSTATLVFGATSIKAVFDARARYERPVSKSLWFVVTLLIWLCAFKGFPGLLQKLLSGSLSGDMLIPLGISYYTFKLIHYCVERGRGNFGSVRTGEYLAWLLLFPAFIAGPIEQLDHFQRERSQAFDWQLVIEGIWRIMQGLVKKFVIAEMLVREELMKEKTVSGMLDAADAWPLWKVWAFMVLLYMYSYLDFSSYSDLAIGGARLFGIRLVENFRWPMLANNISEFWKRWHMSLAGWCQRYVYMPIIARTRNPYIAVYGTFTAMGLWHAMNFNYFSWGLYHATGVTIVLTWGRIKRRWGWQNRHTGLLAWWGVPVTFAFITFSGVFSGTTGLGASAMLKLGGYLFGIQLNR